MSPSPVRIWADALPEPGTVERVHVGEGEQLRPGQPLVEVGLGRERHVVTATGEGVVHAVHVLEGDLVGPGWPLLDITPPIPVTSTPELVPTPPPGALHLAWTHDGMDVRPADVQRRIAVDVGLLLVAAALALVTMWSLFGFARALVVGTGATSGLWCLLVAPGLAWVLAQASGERLLQQVVGVRRLHASADTLELRTWWQRTRLPLADLVDVLPTERGLRLVLTDGVDLVTLPFTSAAQRAWISRGLRAAANSARSLPPAAEPPPELDRLHP